jgi:RimJ/RimL family protein N-acetyltransferase
MFAITQRLLLRPGWAEDAPALAEAIAHEAVAMKLARLPWPYTQSDAAFWLSLPRSGSDANFLIFSRTMGAPRLIGGVGLHDQDGETEIGYWLSPPYWGLGFATEAARAVVDIARHTLKLPRLVSGHFVDNPASGHVLRKIGLKPTGKVEPRECVARGREVACVLYAMDLSEDDEGDMPARTLMAA